MADLYKGLDLFNKKANDPIRSGDWNKIGDKLEELNSAKVNKIGGDLIEGSLSVKGQMNVIDKNLNLIGNSIIKLNDNTQCGLGWFKNWANSTLNGPVLFGLDSGILGTIDTDFTNAEVQKAVLSWNKNGNVGIGTTNPQSYLSFGSSYLNGKNEYPHDGAKRNDVLSIYEQVVDNGIDKYGFGIHLGTLEVYASGQIQLGKRGFIGNENGVFTAALTVTNSGNVGIGKTDPSEKLEVNGNLKVTGTCNSSKGGNFNGVSIGYESTDSCIKSPYKFQYETIYTNNPGYNLRMYSHQNIIFHSGNSEYERLIIDQNGNVTIGKSLIVNGEIHGKIWKSGIYTWNQGEPEKQMGPVGKCIPILLEVHGKFQGGGEAVRITENGGYWYLSGQSQQTEVGGSAICIAFSDIFTK